MNVMANRPRRLESYVGGQWVAGAKEGVPLLDASTGAPVAFIDSTGIDFKAILAHGVHFNAVDMPAFRRAAQPLLDEYLRHPDLDSLYRRIRDLA